jgi:hypothetical protein
MIRTEHIEQIPILEEKFESAISTSLRHFREEAETSMDLEMKSIRNMLDLLHNGKENGPNMNFSE